jgi:hypothetical protein
MRTLIYSLALLAASTLHAARFEVVRNGVAVEGAEVCLFRAGAVGSPVTRFFASPEVTCSPASGDVAIGDGAWNAFARKGTALISERVELVTADEAKAKRPRLELVDAAALDRKVAEGERPFVWIPRTRSALPVIGSVPAAMVVPLVVAKGAIVRVDAPLTLAAGETRTLDAAAARPGRVDVVVPVVFRTTPEGGGEAPEVAVVDPKGTRHAAAVPLARSDIQPGETLLFFREVPAGALTASLTGARWKDVESKLEPGSVRVVLGPPIEARATTKLTLHWWTPVNPATLAETQRTCTENPQAAIPFQARLLFCGDDKGALNAAIGSQDCTAAGERPLTLDALRGTATFEDAAAGVYMVEVAYPRLPAIRKKIEVAAKESTDVDVELRWFTFYGRVTRGGEPLAAELFGTVSDPETGRYQAVLPRNPETNPTRLRTCDGGMKTYFVPDQGPVENAAYDIDIAANRIAVDVVDAASKQPVPKLRVMLAAMKEDSPDAAYFSSTAGLTDEQGKLRIEPVIVNKRLLVCAVGEEYDRTCADPFTMGEAKEKSVRLEVQKIVRSTGRIVSPLPFEYGQLVWVTPAGTLSETVDGIDATGHFTYKKPHAEGEMLTFTAENHPLVAMLQPRVADGEELVIRIPSAPRRTFRVSLSEDSREEGAFIALRIGGSIVSSIVSVNALSWHLQRRGLQSSLMPGHSTTVADILATGPIRVILVPFSMAARYTGRVELPLVPEIGTFPQMDLAEAEVVVFGQDHPRATTPWGRLPAGR